MIDSPGLCHLIRRNRIFSQQNPPVAKLNLHFPRGFSTCGQLKINLATRVLVTSPTDADAYDLHVSLVAILTPPAERGQEPGARIRSQGSGAGGAKELVPPQVIGGLRVVKCLRAAMTRTLSRTSADPHFSAENWPSAPGPCPLQIARRNCVAITL